jgi:type II secretory pathway component GspD/PulD (secretin)/tetratricopeptide (TPR) repeat protein
VGIAVVSTASAQMPPTGDPSGQPDRVQTRPSHVRNALRRAQDYYRKGEYELASTYFQQAQAGLDELTPAEQDEMRTWSRLNATAMQARRDGNMQLRQIELAMQQGRTQDAIVLLKVVSQNQQFLAAADKSKIQGLSEQLLPGNSNPIQQASGPNAAEGSQARTMLRQARVFMSRGNYDAAQALAREAEQKGVAFGPREDTPQKVLSDIAVMRAAPAVPDDPKSLLAAARQSLTKGDLDAAEQFALAAEKHTGVWSFSLWGDSPAKVLKEVRAARAKQGRRTSGVASSGVEVGIGMNGRSQPGSNTANVASTPVVQTTATASTDTARSQPQDPRMLLKQARQLYDSGKLDDAEKMAHRAEAGKKSWGLFDDSPEKLLADVRKAKTKRDQEESAHALVEAHTQFKQGNLQEAKRLTYKAEHLHHGPYNVWELDRPQKLRAEIEVTENKQRKTQLPPPPGGMVAKAGSPDQRPALADSRMGQSGQRQTQTAMQNSSSAYTPAANDSRQAVSPAAADLRTAPVVPAPLPPLPTTIVPASHQQAAAGGQTPAMQQVPSITTERGSAKLRAQMLVAEARQLQKEGRLGEARQKAMEAQRIGANFAPDEDRPEVAMIQISHLCQERIDRLLQQASEATATAGTDPMRRQRAIVDLQTARQLAVGCGFDTRYIDGKLAILQPQGADNRATGPDISTTRISQLPHEEMLPAATTDDQHGRDLLNQAQRELRAGQTGNARRLAEAAFDAKYGVQNEAQQMLRSIDVEEFNQKALVANRAFEAGTAAYNRREFSQAGSIMRSIDPHLLSPEKQARLKEIMLVPEMQLGAVAQATLKPLASQAQMTTSEALPGKAQASDMSPNHVATPDSDFIAQARALQEIKFQKLRNEGLAAQSEATKRFNAGDTDKALDLLQDYVSGLGDSGLDAEKLALLKRPVEARMQQLRTLKHQRDFEKMQASDTENAKQRISRGMLAEQEKKQQISQLMKQFDTSYKEGKYKEAEMYAMRARELDPDDAIAGAAITMARMQANVVAAKELKQRKEDFFVTGLNDAEEPGPSVDMHDPLKIDKEIFARAKDRKTVDVLGVSQMKSEREREIYHKLDNPISSMEFKDTPLRQILDDLHSSTGINIVPDEPALQEAGITLEHAVTMKLDGVALKSALNLLLHQAHLTYVVKDEVLNVTTEDHARGKQVTKVHPVLDLVLPVENSTGGTNVLKSIMGAPDAPNSNLKLNNATPFLGMNSIAGGQDVSQLHTLANPPTPASSANPTVTVDNPKGTLQEVLIKLITNTIAPQTWASVGGQGTIDYYPLGMALVINQTPDIQEQVAELLSALRRLQDQEVAVEVRFITLAEQFFERIGVDFNINIRNNNSRYEPQLVSQQFRPFGFINNFTPKRFITGLTPAGSFTQDLGIPINDNSFNLAVPPFGGFPQIPGGNGGIDLGLAFLSDIEVFLFMEAAQGDQRTNVMQAPKLTLFNGQTSTLSVTDEQFFVTQVQVVQAGGQIVFVPFNNIIPTTGVNLFIQAVISADRRFVRLNLAPILTNIASANVPLFPITTFITPIFEGGAVGQPVPFTQFLQQPAINVIRVETTVNVPDGGTVLMGGFKRMSEGRNEFGPPILSKIPYINRLFKNVGYGRQTESLLMMVTPRIIINEEEEQRQVGTVTGGGPGLEARVP